MRIETHRYPYENATERVDDALAGVPGLANLVENYPLGAGIAFSIISGAAAGAVMLDRNRSEALALLRHAMDLGVAAFDLMLPRPTEVLIDGQRLALDPTGPTDETHPPNWLMTFGLALLLRQRHAAGSMSAMAVDPMRNSSTRVDGFRYELVVALQEFEKGGDWRAARARVLELNQRALESGDPELSLLPMLDALEAHDGAAFNAALASALEAHKRQWSLERDWVSALAGMLAFAPLGLAALAYDRGIDITVESPYIPEWLVHGRLAAA